MSPKPISTRTLLRVSTAPNLILVMSFVDEG